MGLGKDRKFEMDSTRADLCKYSTHANGRGDQLGCYI